MNKRIHELVRQCGGYHIDDDGEEGKAAVLVGKDVEEFAKLIVRECIIVLDEDDGATHHTELLKEHFGVE
jgi:hypothetical protein